MWILWAMTLLIAGGMFVNVPGWMGPIVGTVLIFGAIGVLSAKRKT